MAHQTLSYILPTINMLRCTGCGQCAELCPTNAVDILNNKAVITRPQDCTFCEICESYCPEAAIERPFTISLKSESIEIAKIGD